MLDLIMAFALGMSIGAWLVVRFMVPVAFEAGADQARREDAPPSPSIYHSEVNKDRTAREDRPCAE